ncbi:hypothetical protein PROFUN_12930 [Planoprotostelium fungivorum]|uniref:EGF-like domain-containing protein n=1 Tax=Planoprotostelium fungivorum TaxID=1890364 RepID=A0A2P6N5Z8_9EUKA|nr:hypothetical protein PROFUN_12930 [Planoprotostelium fungivorum]
MRRSHPVLEFCLFLFSISSYSNAQTDLCNCGSLRLLTSVSLTGPTIDVSVVSPDYTETAVGPHLTITTSTKTESLRCTTVECTNVEKSEWPTFPSDQLFTAVPYVDLRTKPDAWIVDRVTFTGLTCAEGQLHIDAQVFEHQDHFSMESGLCLGWNLYNLTVFKRNQYGYYPIALYNQGGNLALVDIAYDGGWISTIPSPPPQYKGVTPIRGVSLGDGSDMYSVHCPGQTVTPSCKVNHIKKADSWMNGRLFTESPLSVAVYNGTPIITVSVRTKGLETIRCLDAKCTTTKQLPVVEERLIYGGFVTVDPSHRIVFTSLLSNGSIMKRTCDDNECSTYQTKTVGKVDSSMNPRIRDASTETQFSIIAFTETMYSKKTYIYNECNSNLMNIAPAQIDAHTRQEVILLGNGFCTSRAYKCTTSDGLFSSIAKVNSEEDMSCTLPNTMVDGIYDITVNDVSGSVKLMVGDCGCGVYGTCNPERVRCDCRDGYSGEKCDVPPTTSTTSTTSSTSSTTSTTSSTSSTTSTTSSMSSTTSKITSTTSSTSSTTSTISTSVATTTSQSTDISSESMRTSTTTSETTTSSSTTGQSSTSMEFTTSSSTTSQDGFITGSQNGTTATSSTTEYDIITSFNDTSTSGLLDDSEWKDKRVKASIVIERLTLLNLKNILTVVNLPIEFLQLSFFGLALREGSFTHHPRFREYNLYFIRYISLWNYIHTVTHVNYQFHSEELVMVEFFVVFACTLSWSLLVLPVMFMYKGRPLMVTLLEIPAIKSLFSLGVLLIIPFGTFLVLPSIRMLLRMSECKHVPDEVGLYVRGTTMECWTQDQIVLCVMGLIGLGIYFPLAVYILPKIQTSDGTAEILRNTRFLFIQKMLYVSIVVIQVLCSEELYNIICAIVVSLLLFLVSFDGSCNVRWINRTQTVMYIAAFWTACMSLWAQVRNKDDSLPPPLMALFAGYLLILLLFVLSWIPQISSFHRRQQTDLLSALIGGMDDEKRPLMTDSSSEIDLMGE